MRTRAAVLRELGKPLSVEDLEVPRLLNGQVFLRMQQAGVCHSQKLEVSGQRGSDRFLPHLIGHEGVGEVLEVGPGVTKVCPGDQVVLTWIRASDLADEPIFYESAKGRVNAGPIATFCETPVVSEKCAIRIHPAVEPEMAVLAGCALPTGAGTVWNAMIAQQEDTICIFGLGGVGLSAICGAVLGGWGKVVGVDLSPSRLQRAVEVGATHVIRAGEENTEELILNVTEGKGFDLVVECAGSAQAMEMAVRVAKPKGGKIVIVGNLARGKKIQVDPFHFIEGRWLGGSWGGGVEPEVDIPRLVRLVESGAINRKLLLGKRFAFEEVNEALLALSSKDPGRPVIVFSA